MQLAREPFRHVDQIEELRRTPPTTERELKASAR
jgi:hypothetical protein